jgi:hypothetical protein
MEMYYYRGHMVIGHDGNISGFGSRFIFMPDLKFGVVILGNSAGAGGAATMIIRALMDQVLEVPIEQRPSQNTRQQKKRNGKKDLAIHSTSHPDDEKELHSQDQQPRHSKELALEDSQARLNAKKIEKKETKQPQRAKNQARKPNEHEKPPPPPQEIPLVAYVGRYWNAGYRAMTVTIKDDQLFIDATDRSNGFTMAFEHVKDQTEYIAHTMDAIELEDEPVDARFVFEDGRAVRMGLNLEPAIKEMIWFERDGTDVE